MSTDPFDLDQLKSAMDEATPAPDAAKRAENIALAQKNFDNLQGSALGVRPTSDRPVWGPFRGVKTMLNNLTTRGALTATTALAAFGLILIVPQISQMPTSGIGGTTEATPIDAALETRADEATRKIIETPKAVKPLVREQAQGIILEESESDARGRSELSFRAAPASPLMEAPMADMIVGSIAPPINTPNDGEAYAEPDTEAFPDAAPNPLKITSEEPVSTFSIDVDTASYSIIRSSLSHGQLPPVDAVRVEEMINYFPYAYPAPEGDGTPFLQTVNTAQTPWNPDTQLVHIAIQGEMPQVTERPPLNLVFLIDTSGSMNQPDKLPLLRQSLALMLPRLTANDSVAIVAYAGSSGQVLAPTQATDKAKILAALDNLSAGGGTAGQAGLQQAYSVAESMAEEGEVTRVILATDGDFNVGLSDPEALKDFIAEKRDSGTYLSVLGFGRGNLDDATMQALAQNGNGQAAYIDTLSEAQKVLVDQFTGALFPIAGDVKVQVEFNPAVIAEYRLIGYETRALNREDFNNDKVDAGDIGAGHSVTALYEVTPVGSPAQLSDPLRYGAAEVAAASGEMGFLKLRYKEPSESTSKLIETPISADLGTLSDEARFAAAIAGFGQLLRNNTALGDWGYDEAIALANSAKGEDAFGYRAEAVRLMRLAQSLSNR